MAPRHGRQTLQQGLDREMLQVVRKYQDTQPESEIQRIPSEQAIYGFIQRSNSTLKRRPKQQLEASIERVLDVLREDAESDEEQGLAELDFQDSEGFTQNNSDFNLMNKALRAGLAPENEKARKRDKLSLPNGEPARKKRKPDKGKAVDTTPPIQIQLEDIGGCDDIIRQLRRHLTVPLLEPETYITANLDIPRGVLLHGPPGCGKSVLCRAVAAELGVPFIEILGPSVVSGMSGESEQKIRERFEEARNVAPCLMFIDEIDVIAPKRDSAQSQMEKRIVAQLLISMDGLAAESNNGKPVIVLAATNRPDSIDPALRRGGRFGTEINMGVPNEITRRKILEAQTRKTVLAEDVDFAKLAKMTSGFVGADLRDLVTKAGEWSMDRYQDARERQAQEAEMVVDNDGQNVAKKPSDEIISWRRLVNTLKDKTLPKPEGFETMRITMEAFLAALPTITPSSKREGFATVPDTTWKDIGALQDIRKALEMAVVQPIQDPERFKRLGIVQPSGVLLWGPPGCGKTLLAKAVARESKANFISVKGAELLNKYLGESERAIRQVFTRARSSVPCILFIDEIDSLIPKRDASAHEASVRVVTTLLTELDGLSDRQGIFLVAATNRPDMIDPAMLRPGRLGKLLYVGLPGPDERVEILRALVRKTPIDDRLADLARREECAGFSGADLAELLRAAGEEAVKRGAESLEERDFMEAFRHARPSVQDVERYERMRNTLRNSF